MIESRSIGYIPKSERHGKVWHQGPFWFMGQFIPTTMVVGFLGPALGLSFTWSAAALLAGLLFGTWFMALHANQGPTMGLPQMIQSRAQFGIRGALVPMSAVIFVYVGFSAFGVLLGVQALSLWVPWSATSLTLILVGSAALLAIFGYDVLHFALRWLPVVVVPLFGLVTVLALTHLSPSDQAGRASGVSVAALIVQFSAAAGYQLSYAVYVSDYSRYLPAESSARAVVGWTYAGAALSPAWLMVLGSYIASSVPVPDVLPNLQGLGDHVFDGFGTIAAILLVVPPVIALMGVGLYGAMLSGLGILEAFRPLSLTPRVRVWGVLLSALAVAAVSEGLPEQFLGNFNDFITLLLYVLIPWSAVNLVDYYFVRHGHYAITEIFNPSGIYGKWGWRGLVAYAIGIAAMIPFMAIGSYQGFLVKELDGADIAFLVGLAVSGFVYWAATRRFDPATETEAIEASSALLDGETATSEDSARMSEAVDPHF